MDYKPDIFFNTNAEVVNKLQLETDQDILCAIPPKDEFLGYELKNGNKDLNTNKNSLAFMTDVDYKQLDKNIYPKGNSLQVQKVILVKVYIYAYYNCVYVIYNSICIRYKMSFRCSLYQQ